jgi:hypothetical protein
MTNRTSAYRFTVRMIEGKVHPEDQAAVDGLRTVVKLGNTAFSTSMYVKMQGRLGTNNPNAEKYGRGRQYHNHQAIRLTDASTADVYVYNR